MTTKAQAINKVIALSKTQLGTHESGNVVKYTEWYAARHGAGWRYALWCNIYVSWLFNQCGYAVLNGGDYASTVSQYNWCRSNATRVSFSNTRPGDLVFYKFPTSGSRNANVVNHIDIAVGYYNSSTGRVATHGGNTPKPGSYGDPSNGRGVWAHSRTNYAVVAVFRLPWSKVVDAAQTGSNVGSAVGNSAGNTNHNLERGDRGANVGALQRYLNSRSGVKPKIKADKVFGPATQRALKQWQQNNHLVADGKWGPKCRAKRAQLKRRRLHVSGNFPLKDNHFYGVNDNSIRSHSGARKADVNNVKRIQRQVGASADGKFGVKTANEVKKFQGSNRLTRDGKVGPATWRAMARKTG